MGSLDKALVPTVVLFELAYFFVKHKLDLKLLGSIITDPKVEVVPNSLDDFLFLMHHSQSVKYYDDIGDLVIVSVAKRLGVQLRTFDRFIPKLEHS